MPRAGEDRGNDQARRRRSVRMALVLASVAVVFFAGVVASTRLGGISVVMSTAGIVLMIVLALIVAWGARK